MDVYAYDDYRAWLRDAWRSRSQKLTHREFAKQAGFSNPGYLNDVIKGTRQLSPTALAKVIKVFGLEGNEAEFFTLLVEFSRARNPERKKELYAKVLFRRNRSSFTRVDPARSRYYQDYRYPLVRAAIEASRFRGDYASLAKFLDPPLAEAQVRKCVRDLCEWGLVIQHPNGQYKVTDKLVEPASDQGELIRRLNRHWIQESALAIDRLGPDRRHISTILLNVSSQTAAEVRSKLERFREEVFQLIRADENPETVLQLSLALFPRTKVRESRS